MNTQHAFNPDQFMIETATDDLRPFMGRAQLATMRELAKGEESVWFITRMVELAALIHSMPKTYEQDGKGNQAVASLHYFMGGMDWYITEKDSEPEQLQAFGLADLGYGGEIGYISLVEILEAGAELDLHFAPQTLEQIKGKP